MTQQTNFPHGLRVYLRTSNLEGDLHFNTHTTARNVLLPDKTIFTIVDEEKKVLGFYPVNSVSAIIPIEAPDA